jgi:spermidine/putrescine-binding protein
MSSFCAVDCPSPEGRLYGRRQWLTAAAGGLAAVSAGGCKRLLSGRGETLRLLISGLPLAGQVANIELDRFPLLASLLKPLTIFEDFKLETGITVTCDFFTSPEDFMAKLTAPDARYDLAMPSAATARELFTGRGLAAERGRLAAIDPARVKNLRGVDWSTHGLSFDPTGRFIVPYLWSCTGICYDERNFIGVPKSWAELFKPPALDTDNRAVSVFDDARITLGTALLYLGFTPFTRKVAQLEQAGDLLHGLRDRMHFIRMDQTQEELLSGQVSAVMAISSEASRAMDGQGRVRSLRLALPREGSIVFKRVLVLPQSGANRSGAERLLDFLLRPKVVAAVSNVAHSASTVPAANRFVSPFVARGPAHFRQPAGKNFSEEEFGELDSEYERVWRRVRNDAA